jgi:hypothetical protein
VGKPIQYCVDADGLLKTTRRVFDSFDLDRRWGRERHRQYRHHGRVRYRASIPASLRYHTIRAVDGRCLDLARSGSLDKDEFVKAMLRLHCHERDIHKVWDRARENYDGEFRGLT